MFQSVILCIYVAVVCRVSALPENFVFRLKIRSWNAIFFIYLIDILQFVPLFKLLAQQKRTILCKNTVRSAVKATPDGFNAMMTEIIIIGAKVVIFSQPANVFAFQSHEKWKK